MLKRLFDVIFSGSILFLMAPIVAIVALTILFESGRPVFFRQTRVGMRFRNFQILKFRTMHASCGGPAITVSGDSRVTRTGKILRLLKLDELPQFWNVFKGQMSIVGPRPEVPEYVDSYRKRYKEILEVRPGITDLASIYYRNEEAILSRSEDPLAEYKKIVLPAKLDLAERYIRDRSALADLRIIAETVIVMLRPKTVLVNHVQAKEITHT